MSRFYAPKKASRDYESNRISQALMNSSENRVRKMGHRMDQCFSFRKVKVNFDNGEYRIKANYCRSKFCVRCQRLRSRTNMYYLSGVLKALENDKTIFPAFLTFTPRENCHPRDLKPALSNLHKTMEKIFRGGLFKHHRVGHYRNSEFTSRGPGKVHPHMHYLMHFEKKDISQEKSIRDILNSKFFHYALKAYYLRSKKVLGGEIDPAWSRIDEVFEELSHQDQQGFNPFLEKKRSDCVRRLKKGQLPILMLVAVCVKAGLGHQIRIQKPNKNSILELCKYNTKTIDYEGAEMEDLAEGTDGIRFNAFSGRYREEKAKMKKLELEEKEESEGGWDDYGNLDDVIADECLKEPHERDPKLWDFLLELKNAGLVDFETDQFDGGLIDYFESQKKKGG